MALGKAVKTAIALVVVMLLVHNQPEQAATMAQAVLNWLDQAGKSIMSFAESLS